MTPEKPMSLSKRACNERAVPFPFAKPWSLPGSLSWCCCLSSAQPAEVRICPKRVYGWGVEIALFCIKFCTQIPESSRRVSPHPFSRGAAQSRLGSSDLTPEAGDIPQAYARHMLVWICAWTSSIACGIKAATQITGLIAKLKEIMLYYDIFAIPVQAI